MKKEKNYYYQVLGVDKKASQKEIEAARNKCNFENHPDRTVSILKAELKREPTEQEIEKKRAELTKKTQEINEAYEVLSDPQKRTIYDQQQSGDFFNQNSSGHQWSNSEEDIFSDIFRNFPGMEDIFGEPRRNRSYSETRVGRPQAGEKISISLNLSFKESVFGTTKKKRIELNKACPSCRQTGANSPNDIETC